MAKAKKFIEEDVAKVRKYPKKSYNGKEGILFTLGKRIRLRYVEMVGIVNGEVTDLTDPAGTPYLVLADKKQGKTECRFFATNGQDYYDLNRMREGSLDSDGEHYPGYVDDKECAAFDKDCFWQMVTSRRTRLSTHYQNLAKQVLNEYFNHAFNLEDK